MTQYFLQKCSTRKIGYARKVPQQSGAFVSQYPLWPKPCFPFFMVSEISFPKLTPRNSQHMTLHRCTRENTCACHDMGLDFNWVLGLAGGMHMLSNQIPRDPSEPVVICPLQLGHGPFGPLSHTPATDIVFMCW